MKKIFLSIFGGVLLTFASCTDVLDVLPEQSLDQSVAYTDRAGIEAGLIGAYSNLQSGNYFGLRHWLFSDMMGGLVNHTGTFPSFLQIFQHTILPNNVEVTNYWNTVYNGINRVNNLIEVIPNVEEAGFSDAIKSDMLGQLRFLRAYHYFNLVSYFGGSPTGYTSGEGVPLVLRPTLSTADATATPKSPLADVWEQIDQDLTFAIANITRTGVAFSSRNAAIALKARTHLYRGEWAQAADFSGQIISGTGSDLVANYRDLFALRNQAVETIWELNFDPVNSNSIAFFFFPTANGGRNEVAPNAAAIGYEPGDLRAPVTIAASPTGTSAKYNRIATNDDNVILFRRGEAYLTRAEALARIGGPANLTAAYNLTNLIRARAGVPDLDALLLTDQAGLINAILAERRRELAIEGHQWFDLRRTNRAVAFLAARSAEPFRALWPIPEREINAHAGTLSQNDGY